LIHIESVSSTTVLSRESIARHVTLRIVNDGASIVDLVSAVAFSSIFNTDEGIRINIAVGSADLGAHQSIVGGGVWGQSTNVIAFSVASNADTGDSISCNGWLMNWSCGGGRCR
jgi:hypothetical protein